MATIAGLLWDDFEIEGRSAAYASQQTYETWESEQYISPEDYSAASVWNDALRLGFLIGSGRVTLGDLREPQEVTSDD